MVNIVASADVNAIRKRKNNPILVDLAYRYVCYVGED